MSELPTGDALQGILDLLSTVATYLWTYYSELIHLGFSEDQAMELTHSVQIFLFQQGKDAI